MKILYILFCKIINPAKLEKKPFIINIIEDKKNAKTCTLSLSLTYQKIISLDR